MKLFKFYRTKMYNTNFLYFPIKKKDERILCYIREDDAFGQWDTTWLKSRLSDFEPTPIESKGIPFKKLLIIDLFHNLEELIHGTD